MKNKDWANMDGRLTVVVGVIITSFLYIIFVRGGVAHDNSVIGKFLQPLRDDRKVYIGLWTQGFWNDETKELDVNRIREVEREIGKKFAIAHYYRGWEALDSDQVVAELNTISNQGWTPMISVNPYEFSGCRLGNMTLYEAVASGNCDDFLRSAAVNLEDVEEKFFIRFAWEMNIDSIEWSVQRTGSTSSEYVLAWRRMHNIFQESGVENAIWVFSPQIRTPTSVSITDLYPGDEFVDWVALDGYNWGNTQSWSQWQEFDQVFEDSYTEITQVAPDKPLMIAEVNSTNVGGDKGEWYSNMLTHLIPDRFTEIDAVVFFNEDKTHNEGVNWLFDTPPETLKIFKEAISNPIYRSDF